MSAAWVGALVLAGAGCSRCGPKGAPAVPVERLLPKGAVAVVVVPSIEKLGARLTLLEALKIVGFVAQLQGFSSGREVTTSLMAELGVDLRDKAALERAGLDATRGLGVAMLVSGESYLVLPVKDAAKFHLALETLAYRRLSAGAGGEQKTGPVVVKTFSVRAGGAPVVGYALVGDWALVANEGGVARLPGLAGVTESDSLAADLVLKASMARVPSERDVWAYAPHGSPLLMKAPVTSALVTAALSPTALTVSLDAPWKGEPSALGLFRSRAGAALAGYLPADAFLVARYNGDPVQLAPFSADLLGPWVARAFAEGGFDLKTEVLTRLQPGATLALSLAQRPPLAQGMPTLDLRQTNPFSYAHLSGVVDVNQPETVVGTLDQVATVAPRFGAKMSKVERAGAPVFITSWAQGEGVHFASKGSHVFFASPVQRLDALLASDGKGAPPVQGLGDEAIAAAIDLRKLAQSVRQLPESAWGLGGFAIKATTVRWLDATDDLHAITLGLGAKDQVVQGRLVLELGLGPAPR